MWQGLAGGGEDNETPRAAALREAYEEAAIPTDSEYIALDARASVPVVCFSDHRLWAPDLYVIPEHSFGVRLEGEDLRLSAEHTAFQWLSYEDAYKQLTYDSNRIALWELNRRLDMMSGAGQ